MAEGNFPACLALVLKDEGGNDDDPADHGGRTSRGITQREYDAWRAENGQPARDVWSADQAEIEAIYRDEYWQPWCDLLPVGIDYLYFDMAVNAGPHQATVLLQRALGVTDDGRIGPVTRGAIKGANPVTLIHDYSDAKRKFYFSLDQPRFTRGWLNRTDHVEKAALAMLTERQPP